MSTLSPLDGSTSTVSTPQPKYKSGETGNSFILSQITSMTCTVLPFFLVDGSESTLSTPQDKYKCRGNSSSGSSAVSDTSTQVVYSQEVLEVNKIVQMFHRRNTIKLKSQKMNLKCKHKPTLHFTLESSLEDNSAEYIILHAHIVLPRKYNRMLDTAKFQISVTTSYHSASNTPLPLLQPEPQTFTLENKHMAFNLFPRTFVRQNSISQSVHLVIEVQLIYYVPPMTDYEARNPTESLDFVDIQKRTGKII